MATLNHVLDAIERQIGFPRSRSNGIARRLQESNLLPVGAPGVAPELNEDNVLDLVVALASDTELHNAVGAVRAYHAMTPGGADLSGAPDTLPNAPIAIAVLVESARVGVAEARKSQIAVSCNWRAVAIHKPDGSVSRFSQPGAHCAHWQSNGHHKSITLTVAAIADALDDIFGKVN